MVLFELILAFTKLGFELVYLVGLMVRDEFVLIAFFRASLKFVFNLTQLVLNLLFL